MTDETARDVLEQRFAEQLLDDESLRADLTDDEYQPLQDWALDRLHARAVALADPYLPRGRDDNGGVVDCLRQILRAADDTVGHRYDLDAARLRRRAEPPSRGGGGAAVYGPGSRDRTPSLGGALPAPDRSKATRGPRWRRDLARRWPRRCAASTRPVTAKELLMTSLASCLSARSSPWCRVFGVLLYTAGAFGRWGAGTPAPQQRRLVRRLLHRPEVPRPAGGRDTAASTSTSSRSSTAQRSLDVAIYDFDLDNAADALVRAKGRGVPCAWSWTATRWTTPRTRRSSSAVGKVKSAGIPIVGDNRQPIMHDKFVVRDGDDGLDRLLELHDRRHLPAEQQRRDLHSRDLAENYAAEFRKMFEAKQFGPNKAEGRAAPGHHHRRRAHRELLRGRGWRGRARRRAHPPGAAQHPLPGLLVHPRRHRPGGARPREGGRGGQRRLRDAPARRRASASTAR